MKKAEVELGAIERVRMAIEDARAFAKKAFGEVIVARDEAIVWASSSKAKHDLILVKKKGGCLFALG